MSASSAIATSAPKQDGPLRASAPRQHRGADGGASLALVGAPRAERTAASDALEAQRLFLAYAAHELRGEIAVQRALAEVALADPGADGAALRQMGASVVRACVRQERLLAALLTLSRSECGRLRRESVDLATTVTGVMRAHDAHGLRSTSALGLARTTGDPDLLERLVANLLANAIRHNVAGGHFDIVTHTSERRAVLSVENSGPLIAPGELARLFEPFERLGSPAGLSTEGAGLGLAIVAAIADAHGATVTAAVRRGGGLRIDVAFCALD
ncbi:MAG TPA: ATP-binding protein [Solirubrobacteraceae bacterium]